MLLSNINSYCIYTCMQYVYTLQLQANLHNACAYMADTTLKQIISTYTYSVTKLYRDGGSTLSCACADIITSLVAIYFFWNKQYLPSKGIELWNLAQTWMSMENGSVNTLKFTIFKLCHFKAFDDYTTYVCYLHT